LSSLNGLDGLLVSNWENVRYLTGFTGSNGAALFLRTGDAVVATDGRYLIQVAAEAPGLEVIESRQPLDSLLQYAIDRGAGRLAVEAQHLSLAAFRRLQQASGTNCELVETTGIVEGLRAVKDEGEVQALRQACAITDAAFAAVVLKLRPGVTERAVADQLYAAMRAAGAEAAAFDSIVGFGPNSAIPHHQPTARPLQPGDLVKTDFGARYAGYHADMTRTVVVGPAADWQRDIHTAVANVQNRGVAAAKPGAAPVELDAMAREGIVEAGHRVFHGLGHGVGLQIHEAPLLVPTSTAEALEPGMVITIEPGIYLEGQGGVRIEDTLLIGESGAERLTQTPRELIEI
jgi:Xaa-Pro aminopeptidase